MNLPGEPLEFQKRSRRRPAASTFVRILGGTLFIASLVGFLSVADDLRHVGELLGVASLALAGIALLLGTFDNVLSRHVALLWVAVGPLLGSLIGAASDRTLIGVPGGVVVGLLAGWIHRRASRRGR